MCGIDITSVPILWDNREKEYIRKQYKAVFSDADGRLLYYKTFNIVWQ